jgi:hypothetical protein
LIARFLEEKINTERRAARARSSLIHLASLRAMLGSIRATCDWRRERSPAVTGDRRRRTSLIEPGG